MRSVELGAGGCCGWSSADTAAVRGRMEASASALREYNSRDFGGAVGQA